MRGLAVILGAAVLALAGCGEKKETLGDKPAAPPATTEQQATTGTAEQAPPKKDGAAKGTEVIAAGSEFGEMLYGADKQAIYIFQNDPKGKSVCYGECATAWPPVYTEGKPVAGDGVKQELLGTTKRRDGKLQVTYNGKPLYFYVNEKPGEVRCHNVSLNGGLWWVVGPDGKRRP